MPDESVLIGLLKWAALALALAFGVWALVGPKAFREELDGRKRLTRAGLVTLAMILGSSSISGLSLWLENTLKQKNEAQASARAARAEQLQMAAAADLAITKANTGRGLAELQAARAEGREEAVRTQAASLALEAREVLRDAGLARQVALGARENLARTGVALTQIERVLQPLEPLTLTVTWEIPGDAPRMKDLTARMAAQGRIVREEWTREWNAAYRVKPPRPETIALSPGDELYPALGSDESSIAEHLAFANIHLGLLAAGRSSGDTLTLLRQRQSQAVKADLALRIAATREPPIEYVIDTGAVRFTATTTVRPDDLERSGTIVSYPDLERASAIIWIDYAGVLLPPSRPVAVEIRSPSRSYFVAPEAIRRVPMDFPVFLLPRLMRGVER